MKTNTAVSLVALLLVTSFPGFAAKTNPHPFFLRTAVTLNGVDVPAGNYDLTWETEKATVRVTLWKEGRFFATAQGAWVKNGVKYPDDAALLRVNSDGSRSLVEIRFKGIKKSI